MSLPSRYGDAKRPELLPRNPGAEAVECPDPAIGEKQKENERKKIRKIFHQKDMKDHEAKNTQSEPFVSYVIFLVSEMRAERAKEVSENCSAT